MAINRRRLLQAVTASFVLGPMRVLSTDGTQQRLLSCRSDHQGRHYVSVFETHGRILLDQHLPGRGHAIALDPDRTQAAVFARRPGDFIIVLDLTSLRISHRVKAPHGRHFYGHGVFSHDGQRLLTTENAFDTGEGRVGIYDAGKGYTRIGEFPSHGVGPHELKLLGNQHTLVVANGGIRTHPDFPRAKLNLDRMQSTLVYLDLRDGRPLSRHALPEQWHQLSMRHIDVSTDGLVAVAMQFEGPPTQRPPLIALHRQGSELRTLTAPETVQQRMRNYCGSVSFTDGDRAFAVSSPRGNLVTRWDSEGRYLGHFEQPDVCGIASDAIHSWYSDGLGGLRGGPNGDGDIVQPLPDNRWDNHLIVM